MKITLLAILTNVVSIFSVHAQEEGVIESNPFAEARYNYFKKAVIVYNEFLKMDSGSFNTTDLRILQPLGKKDWNLRLDVPLVSTNSNSNSKTGMGDISFAASYIIQLNEKRGIGARARVLSNSASNPSFGSGKWVFNPTIFYGIFLDKSRKLLWLPDLEYQISFAGANDRNDINIGVFENLLLYRFEKNWVSGDIAFRYNEVLEGFQNTAYLEFGRKFSEEAMFYIHPSIGFGDKKAYNTGFEVGLVILY